MKRIVKALCVGVVLALTVSIGFAQPASPSAAGTASTVPRLVNFSGTLKDDSGHAMSGVVGVTFNLYKDQEGGAPLWMETQNVQPDKAGRYSVMLGSASGEGLPRGIFEAGEPRWLGVQVNGQAEQPRVQLLSVPYALKAADAETIGGLPASAFARATQGSHTQANGAGPEAGTGKTVKTNSPYGTANYLPLWTSSSTIQNSNVFQSGAGNVGIGTATPGATLDVHGTGNFSGLVTFASGQTFPGTGTVTSVGTGLGLKGGPITNSGTLTIDTAVVPQLNAANTFTGNQTVSGNLSATGTVSSAGYLIGSNPFDYGSYSNKNAFLGFAGNTTMTGGSNTASGYLALVSNTTGSDNSANGLNALYWNATGNYNTAIGGEALVTNTTGSVNTGVGWLAGSAADGSNVTGSGNSFLGWDAVFSTGSLTNATAIGANAEVAASNSLVLGSIKGVNNATASTNVGIGTTAPRSTLDVDASVNNGLGPTVTLTNNGGSGQVSLDFNTYPPSGSGTYNPAARMLVADANGFTDNIYFWANKIGAPNNGLQPTFSILNGGMVGVNTTQPTQGLQVDKGNALVRGTDNFQNSGDTATLYLGDTSHFIQSTFSYGVTIGTYQQPQALNITQDNGYVGIGTASPTMLLTLLQGGGPAVADGWDVYSSRRWKTNIQTLHGALDKVSRLRGVSYDKKDSGKHEIGVIAEEVGAVVPEVVTWEKNGKDAQGVDYSRLTALLIEATKEQQAQIKKQQEQIRVQQASIARLNSQIKVIKAALKEVGGLSSEVRRAKVELPAIHQ